MTNILLIGFMGVGKGRTARELARQTGLFALDTDDLIESMTKQKIRRIFREEGEAAFRRREQDVARWLEAKVASTIVSTGGGFFQVPNIQRLGRIVYLHAEVEHILERMLTSPKAEKKLKKRPLLKDMEKAKALFADRLPRYRGVADHEVQVAHQPIEQVAEDIAALLQLERGKG